MILAVALACASPASAEIEEARDLMEAGRFEEAREALTPFARSGNADAEELIGVMYALGLGVEKDPERAFEWYLRSSMKGHPGAQSGLGWYYELGPWDACTGLGAGLYVVRVIVDRGRPGCGGLAGGTDAADDSRRNRAGAGVGR